MNSLDTRSTLTRSLTRALQGLAVATPLLLGAVSAHASCPAWNAPSLDGRLAATADQGTGALRRFVERTKTVYQLDVADATARAERFHQVAAQCTAKTAAR